MTSGNGPYMAVDNPPFYDFSPWSILTDDGWVKRLCACDPRHCWNALMWDSIVARRKASS